MQALDKIKIKDQKLQKKEATLKDVKFICKNGRSATENFHKWLDEKAKFLIRFENGGQDFNKWWLDEGGEVLHSDWQSMAWVGKIVKLKSLKVGQVLFLIEGSFIKYKVTEIHLLNNK